MERCLCFFDLLWWTMKEKPRGKINLISMTSLPGLITFLSLIAIWELLVKALNLPLYIVPAPSSVFMAIITDGTNLWKHALVTFQETLIGMSLALIMAMAIAVLMDRFTLFKKAIYPILVVSQTIPVIVLAPIFILYLGFGLTPKIVIVVIMCFFPITISFSDGMSKVDINQSNLARLFGAREWKVYSLVKIPAAAPSLFSGLKVAATYSITGAVVGEWLASTSGLGYYMLRAKNGYMLDKVFACVVIVVILSLLMNGVVKLVERLVIPKGGGS